MKLAGAAYLVVIGVRHLLTGPSGDVMAAAPEHSLRRLYGQGVVVQTLNPKVAIFFTYAFLPQFVDPAHGRGGAPNPRARLHVCAARHAQ